MRRDRSLLFPHPQGFDLRSLRIAFGLMTILPIRLPDDWSPGDSGRASAWYPLVGLVIGTITWLVWNGGMMIFSPLVAGVAALAVWVALTGGLHLDGLADCCDGLLASTSVERRLEIMKDPHIGAFGVIGLILVLLLKAAALASITPEVSIGILLAGTLARWCLLPAGRLPLARPSGMGADFAAGLRPAFIAWGTVIPLGIVIFLGLRGVFAALAGLGTAALVVWFAMSRIKGVSGDVFGMVVEVVEVAVLLALIVD